MLSMLLVYAGWLRCQEMLANLVTKAAYAGSLCWPHCLARLAVIDGYVGRIFWVVLLSDYVDYAGFLCCLA
jgi:hypothetical protein